MGDESFGPVRSGSYRFVSLQAATAIIGYRFDGHLVRKINLWLWLHSWNHGFGEPDTGRPGVVDGQVDSYRVVN